MVSYKKFSLPHLKPALVFPLIITTILLILTLTGVHGSSIGLMYRILYGESRHDPALLANQPQYIRSDEWQWNSQLVIAQVNNHFERVNKNIGDGQDMSIIIDAPYKDWSEIFHPANWGFFILPLNQAFALKWWFMGYLLIIGCYLLILEVLPDQRTVAGLISVGFFFSPFIQWWYQNITIAPLAFGCLIAFLFIRIVKSSSTRQLLIGSALLFYALCCFCLVLYPPFQIPCALVVAVFCACYLVEAHREKLLVRPKAVLLGVGLSVIATVCIIAVFVVTRYQPIAATLHTVYPGNRVVPSGGYNVLHLFGGFMDRQLTNPLHVAALQIPRLSLVNQSEDSNFILLIPFLLLPITVLLQREYRHKKKITSINLLASCIVFLVIVFWLFVPHLQLVGKLTLLNKVPANRLLIGVGLLGIIQLLLFIRSMKDNTGRLFTKYQTVGYAVAIYAIQVSIAVLTNHFHPGYIGHLRAVIFAIPVPIIIFCLLSGYLRLAALGFAAFCIFTSATINPLYRDVDVLSRNPLSSTIKKLQAASPTARWAVETPYLENFVSLNGARSLSGTYSYPQFALWDTISGADPAAYNRFAHVRFVFDRQPQTIPTNLQLVGGGDQFVINSEPCSNYLRQRGVKFLVTESPLLSYPGCVGLVRQVDFPAKVIYIYQMH